MVSRPTRLGTVAWPQDFAARYVAEGYWAGRPLGDLLQERAEQHGERIALVDGELRLTYRDMMRRADAAAARLRRLGLRRDDRLLVQLPNRWEFVILTLACLRLGVIPVMALPAHRRHELSYLAEHSEAVAIAVPDAWKDFDHQALAHEIAGEVGSVVHVLVAGEQIDPGSVDLTALCGQPDAAPALGVDPPDSRDVAVFLLSGGTTGLPKLIARTHDDYAYNARQSARVCEFDEDTVYLGTLPLGHNFPLACPGILGTFLSGGRVVLQDSSNPDRALATILLERVTVAAVVPAVAGRWLDHPLASEVTSLRVLQVGGARIAEELARRVGPTLGCTLQQVFGMAEGLLNYTRLDDPDDVICRTQGRPMCPADEIRIVDADGEPVPDGAAGMLLTRGPYTPRGYYRAAEQNARAFTPDGWYRSGDIVRLDPTGNLIVEGRDKDMINRGGENISAEEIENFAYQVDGVSMAAAVAMPDPDLDERVCLYVVPQPGETVTLGDIHGVMRRAGAAAFKFPERLELRDSLYTTKVGKIDKKALRADIADRLAGERTPSAAKGDQS